MIVVRITGGMGNQMFQYASAYALAKDLGAELTVDLEDYQLRQIHNGYELERVFGIKAEQVDRRKLGFLLRTTPYALRRRLKKWTKRIPSNYYLEDKFDYQPIPKSEGAVYYLEGYFQSERYFLHRRSEVSQLFRLQLPMSSPTAECIGRIQSANSVAIHVRRGDYTNANVQKVHGLLPPTYFQGAAQQMARMTENPEFFVFSDDPNWCEKNLSFNGRPVTFVHACLGPLAWEHMHMMSHCRHHIIANSSFSWWAAWLCKFPQKRIIAPKPWFKDPKKTANDIYQAGTIALESGF